ncbi:MAG: hypothetical protein ABR562_09090 [Thermoplasmatota archaeon]|nr:YbjQ family protein [Halobacteriales archaeon]
MEAVQPSVPPIPVSTTFDVPGRRIVRHIAPVFGVTVRTRAIGRRSWPPSATSAAARS